MVSWFFFLALFVFQEENLSTDTEKLSDQEHLETESTFFPYAQKFRQDRWFPLGVKVKVRIPFRGWIRVKNDEGAIFDGWADWEKPGSYKITIPVLMKSNAKYLTVQTKFSHHTLEAPLIAREWQVLFVGSAEALEARRGQWEQMESVPWRNTPDSEIKRVDPENLPLQLAHLDSCDFIWVEADAFSKLAPGAIPILNRWAVLRGRLFTTDFIRESGDLNERDLPLWESLGSTSGRLLPILHVPTDPTPKLVPKDLAKWTDPNAILLILFFVGVLGWFSLRKGDKSLSVGALISGGVLLFQSLPWIAWPVGSPTWRTVVAFEDQSWVMNEDRFPGHNKKPLIFDPSVYLVIPENREGFVTEWSTKAKFLRSGKQVAGFSAEWNGGQNIESGVGGIRNHWASLNDVSWWLSGMESLHYSDSFSAGGVLGKDDGILPPLGKPSRPLSDQLSSKWVGGTWLLGRFEDPVPIKSAMPWEAKPTFVYLLWHGKEPRN